MWHDGEPFGARDVVASWHAVMNPHNNTFEHEGLRPRRCDRRAATRTPSVVHLRERYPPFVSRFFAPLQEGGKPVLPAHVLSARRRFQHRRLASHPVGTGPFTFVSWARGDRIVLRRFDRYFKGRPGLERIELRFVPSDQTIAAELQEHQIDLIVAPQTSLSIGIDTAPSTASSSTTAPWNSQARSMIDARKPGLNDATCAARSRWRFPMRAILRDITRGSVRASAQQPAADRLGYEPLPLARPRSGGRRLLARKRGLAPERDGVRARDGVRLGVTLVDDRRCDQLRTHGAVAAGVVARGRHRALDQDLSVPHDFRRTERPDLRRHLRSRAL